MSNQDYNQDRLESLGKLVARDNMGAMGIMRMADQRGLSEDQAEIVWREAVKEKDRIENSAHVGKGYGDPVESI